jgi:hypothetical protein
MNKQITRSGGYYLLDLGHGVDGVVNRRRRGGRRRPGRVLRCLEVERDGEVGRGRRRRCRPGSRVSEVRGGGRDGLRRHGSGLGWRGLRRKRKCGEGRIEAGGARLSAVRGCGWIETGLCGCTRPLVEPEEAGAEEVACGGKIPKALEASRSYFA